MNDLACQLAHLRRLLRLRLLALLLLWWLLSASALVLVAVALAHTRLPLNPAPPALALIAVALLAALVAAFVTPLSDRRLARLVERHYPALRESLLTAVELSAGPSWERRLPAGTHGASPQILQAIVRQAEQSLALIPRRSLLDLHRLRPLLIAALITASAAAGLTAVSRDVVGVATTPDLFRADALARLIESAPPSLQGLRITLEPPEYSQLPARTVTDHFTTLAALPGTRVTISALDPPGADLALAINDRPRALNPAGDRLSHQFTLTAPSLWRLTASDATHHRMAQGLLRLMTDNPPSIRVRIPGRDLTLKELKPVKLDALAADDFGLREIAFEYRISLLGPSDSRVGRPSRSPGQAGETPALRDGNWRRVLLPASGVIQHVEYEWDLLPLKLQPGQSVSYRLRAWDNSPFRHDTVTRTYKITLADRLPQDAMDRLQQVAEDQRQAVERVREQTEDIQRQIEQLQDKLQGAGEQKLSAEQAGELRQATQKLQQQAEELQRALGQSEQEVQRHGDALPELSRRLADINRLLRETMDTKLAEALRKLQQAAAEQRPQQAAQSLEQARQAQEQLQQQLDQLLQLLKQAQMEGLLGELRQQFEQLAKQEQALIERRERAQGENDLKAQGRDQQDLARQADEAADKLRSAAEQAAPQDEAIGQKLQAMAGQMQQAGVPQLMRQAAQALKQAQPAQAAPPQQQALDALQQMAGELAGMQASVYEQMRQELSGAAAELAAQALSLSERQERLMQDAAGPGRTVRAPRGDLGDAVDVIGNPAAKRRLEALAQRQQLVSQGAERLGERLQDLAGKSPLVDPGLLQQAGEAAASSAQARRDLAGGALAEAQAGQQRTMALLNRLAAQLVQSQQGFQQASAQMAVQELMKRLQQLAQQQQSLNQMTQQGGQGQPMPLPGGQLAGQQAGLRQSLQQLLGQAAGMERPGASGNLGDQLGGLPAEMDEVEEDLRREQVTQRTFRQQDHILHKMLDAQRSLYDKERESRERVAEAPKPYRPAASPPVLRRATPSPLRAGGTSRSPQDLPLGYEDLTRQYLQARGRR